MEVAPSQKNIAEIDQQIQEAQEGLWQLQQEMRDINSPEDLEALERDIQQCTNSLAALTLQKQLQVNLDAESQKAKEAEIIADLPVRMKNEGYVNVKIRTAFGFEIILKTRYYRRNCDRRKNKRYKGMYPGLLLLGIHERATPLLASLVSGWAALLCSFAEVRQVMLEQGIQLGEKVIRRLAYRYAERVRILQQAQTLPLGENDTAQGRRIVVSIDGGRIRLRENKRGRKTAKGRTRYKGAWREPKLFIVYVIDDKGKLEKSFAPLIDGSLNGPDALFQLLQGYLKSLQIQEAEQVLFVADGAHWIWNRVPPLVKVLGLKAEQVHELLDFYHAVEHLGKVAALRKNWSSKERKSWIKKQRRFLLKGLFDQVVDAVKSICRGRNGKAITTERNYFIRNQRRMDYPGAHALNLPIGSGAVESAVRRVINLRLKGPCIFWHRENAEKILMLRAFYKAGRWNLLKTMACSHLAVIHE